MIFDDTADLLFINGIIYTADEQDIIYQALGVKESQIVFLGNDDQSAGCIGPHTQIINLQGKMIIPGMIDTHIHPPGLVLSELYEVQLFGITSIEGYIKGVKEFINQHPSAQAVFGRGWSWGALSGDDLMLGPQKEYLDQVAPNIPVMLQAGDGHSLWVNSKALAVHGITKETKEPNGGVIVKNPDNGEVRGTLKEGAMRLVVWPEYNHEQYREAMKVFQEKMHSFGITGIFCIASRLLAKIYQACEQLNKDKALTMFVRGAVTISPDEDLSLQFTAIDKLRKLYHSPYLQITGTKFFADGVIEGSTGFLLKPYSAGAGKGDGYYGEFLWDIEKLKQAFFMANQHGLQIHVHSIGDGATRNVLDALEDVHKKMPQGDYRNSITHLQLVDKEDILRFKEMNIIANVQPYWHFKGPHWWEKVDYRILGERAKEEYPLGSFFANGVTVASSSDYSITNVPYPMRGIAIGVMRNMENGAFYGGVEDIKHMDNDQYLLNKKERATVRQMIKSFTINGAYAMKIDQETGSLELGKQADLVVLDQNLLTINPIDIAKVKVIMTFFAGKLVYENINN